MHGIHTIAELRRDGRDSRAIAADVARGRLERVRRGVYADAGVAPDLVRAARVGGRLTCVSAARLHGLRLLDSPARLHIAVGSNAARLRHPDTGMVTPAANLPVRLHWTPDEDGRVGMVPIDRCLEHLLRCLPAESALCALDSARELVEWRTDRPQLLDDRGFAALLDRLPLALRGIAVRSSTASQAIGETLARDRFRAAGYPIREQVRLPGGFWADLLIGDRLVFEVDGEGPHGAPGAFDRDRARWGWIKGVGYLHVSYSHRQILEHWDEVAAVVQMLVRRGEHLWSR